MSQKLFINGKIWLPDGTFKESFGIKNSSIDFSGTNQEAQIISDNYEETIDLNGRLVLPGLTDGHLHLVNGSLMRKRLDCRNVKSFDQLKQLVINYESKNPKSEWIIGSNLDMPNIIGDNINSTGNFTDKIISQKPLFIANYDYHSAICNSLAFEKSGLLKVLDSFSDVNVPKDSERNPIGIIKEEALDFAFENLPNPDLEEKCEAVKEFIKFLHSFGITTVTDITLPGDLDVYKKLFENGELNIRINSYLPFEEFPNISKHEENTKNINHDYYTINGFKAFYDGALGSSSALFSANYNGTNSCGSRTDQAQSGELKSLALEIDKAKRQIIIHAIGDKAVSEVLAICEELQNKNGNSDRRLRIEHAQHINEKDFERFQKTGVIISAQPAHLKYDINLVVKALPETLVKSTHNYKILMNRGVTINFGTDFPIVDVNPFENIQMAITRRNRKEIFFKEFCIPLHECIKAYTINNAYSNFNESAAGTIEKGKVADFVILEDNLFDMDPDKLSTARVWKTFLNGKEVYSLS